ncbi:MAG: beta-ketoacyl-ACP synthase III [Bryobacteraceae bacterium]
MQHYTHNVKISALGCYAPPRLLTNHDLEQMVGTTSQWIMERTGICRRHIAEPGMATSDLAIEAAKIALASRDIDARGLDAVVTCTVTPDTVFPTTTSIVQEALGARRALGFDLSAACCGFVYGLATAVPMVATGLCRKVLVIGADTMSRIVDYRDRTTCVLFGDGAGAMLLEAAAEDDADAGFIDFVAEMDGSGARSISLPAGGSRLPASLDTLEKRQHYIQLQGPPVFKYAVAAFVDITRQLLERNGLRPADLDLWIPHQANRRILCAAAERIGLRPEQVMINLDRYGNTTTATIPLAARDAVADGRLRKGDLTMFASVGAGYTAGAMLWRWAF